MAYCTSAIGVPVRALLPTALARALQLLCCICVVVGAAVGLARKRRAHCDAFCICDCTCDCDCGFGRAVRIGDCTCDCAYGSGFDTSGLPEDGINNDGSPIVDHVFERSVERLSTDSILICGTKRPRPVGVRYL
jgi:hypothetical protein